MNRLFRLSLVFVLVLIISTPTWAYGGSDAKYKRNYKKSKHYSHYLSYFNYKKFKVWIQYRRLVRAYKRAGEHARQKFLNNIGLDLPDASAEIQRIREEYEQQISQLNSTIASNGLQIDQLNSTIASNELQIAQLNGTINSNELQIDQLKGTIDSNEQQIAQLNTTISLHDEQLVNMVASHRSQLNELEAEWRRQADAEYARGLEEGRADCSETPSDTGAHPMINSWSTGGYNPNTVDVDGSGNVYLLDNVNRMVVRYDNSGSQSTPWSSPSFEAPVDLVTDTQGDVLILDQQAEYRIQKYSSDGASMHMFATQYDLVAPTGFFVNSRDMIYVTDGGGAYGGRIVVFSPNGQMIMQFGEAPELDGEVYRDIAINPQDQTMVVLTDSKVAIFDQYGAYMRDWQGNFTAPSGLTLGSQGEIYVMDSGSQQAFEYDANGTLVNTFGTADLVDPGRHDVDGTGMIYVGDLDDQMIKVFQ